MKISSLCFTILLFLGMASPLPAEDLLQNFSGMPWGTSIDAFQGLRPAARSGAVAYYKRDKDYYTIGGVVLPDVVYGFYLDKFFAAYMKISSADSFEKIKRYLDKVYGEGRAQLRINQTIYIWDYLEVKIKLKQYRNRTDGKLAFYYVPLSVKANASRSTQSHEHVYELDDGPPDFEF